MKKKIQEIFLVAEITGSENAAINFLDISLTTFFRVRKFRTSSTMRVIFFFKIFKIESKFSKC